MTAIKEQKTFILAGLVVLVILSIGVSSYWQYKINFETGKVLNHLSQNTEFKARYIHKWLMERKADAGVTATRPLLNKALYQTGQLTPDFNEHVAFIFERVRKAYGYDFISIVDQQGKVLYSSHQITQLHDHAKQLALQSIQTQTILHTSFIVDEKGLQHLDFVAPLLYHPPELEMVSVGAVVLHMDPVREIFPVLNQWPENFSFAITELFLGSQSNNHLSTFTESAQNESYHAWLERLEGLISNKIKSGDTKGKFEHFLDQDNVEHLLYYRQIPYTDWFVISRVERSKVVSPIYAEIIWIGIVLFLLASMVGFSLLRAKAQQQLRIQEAHNKELDETREYFQNLFMDAPVPYQSLNSEGIVLHVNHAWSKLFGYSPEEAKGKHFKNFITEASLPTLSQNFPRFLQNKVVKDVEFNILTKSGEVRETLLEGRLSNPEDTVKLRTHCILVDVTEQRERERGLKLAASVFQNLGEGIMVTDADQKIISVNAAFESILGYTESEVLGKTPSFLHSGKHDAIFYQKMWDSLNTNSLWQGEIWNRKKNGELISELLTISALKLEDGSVDKYVGVFADITQIKQSEYQLEYLANYDILTGLPNRNKFLNAIDFSIVHSKRDQSQFAVLMLDLDLFKNVNDSFGHSVGDEVIIEVNQRLKSQLRAADMLSRLGGDEFVLLLENIESPEVPARIALNLIELIKQPFVLSNQTEVQISASIGISLYPDHGSTASQLFQHADSALYLAKQSGRSKYQYYTEELTENAKQRLFIENELRTAIKHSELRLYYQPQVNLQTGNTTRAEALIRWQHPERGLLMPIDFIPIAEESDLIINLGNWVLKEACRQAKLWRDQNFKPIRVAVNVSAKQLMHSDLYATIVDTLKETQLPVELLEIEITENSLIALGESSIELFEKLHGLGITIAIDDFGTGYSSLSYLQDLSFDLLKIDKKFVDCIAQDEKGMKIVNTIIFMAHSLQLEVLAEGVETQTQLDFLSLRDCDFYQGYLTSPPVTPAIFEEKFLRIADYL